MFACIYDSYTILHHFTAYSKGYIIQKENLLNDLNSLNITFVVKDSSIRWTLLRVRVGCINLLLVLHQIRFPSSLFVSLFSFLYHSIHFQTSISSIFFIFLPRFLNMPYLRLSRLLRIIILVLYLVLPICNHPFIFSSFLAS